jgi:superfamily II helicase
MILRIRSWTPSRRSRVPESRRVLHWFAVVPGEADYATDAIAMGLNLPIGTVVFTTLQKWNGSRTVTLSGEENRQIAGRAGRFGLHEKGVVTALHDLDLKSIPRAFGQDTFSPP